MDMYIYKMIKKIGIYANCQGSGLAYYLTRLFPDCSIDCLGNYQYIASKKRINYKKVKQYDIFIFQPLDEKHGIYSTSKNIKNSIINMLKKDCIKISFPYIYSDAFWPLTLRSWDSKAVPNKENPHGIGIQGYHNSEIILNLLNIENKSKEDIKNLFLEQKINFNFEERFRKSIKRLKEKEEICNIKISDYILLNYKKEKLFLTKNHPTSCIFKVLIEQILKILNIECSLDIFDFTNNNLCNLPGNQPHSKYEIDFFKFQYNVIIDNNYYLKIIDSI